MVRQSLPGLSLKTTTQLLQEDCRTLCGTQKQDGIYLGNIYALRHHSNIDTISRLPDTVSTMHPPRVHRLNIETILFLNVSD